MKTRNYLALARKLAVASQRVKGQILSMLWHLVRTEWPGKPHSGSFSSAAHLRGLKATPALDYSVDASAGTVNAIECQLLMMNSFSRLLVMLLFSLSLISAPAENLYIRAGANGGNNGTNWNHAWSSLSSVVWGSGTGKVGAGDTLWMAGGSYSAFTVGTAGVTIKRARSTNSECTTATGWLTNYDSQVLFDASGDTYSIWIDADNVTIDGQVDSGIKIYNLGKNLPLWNGSQHNRCNAIRARESGITLRYIEIDGGWTTPAPRYGIDGPPDNSDGNETGLTVSHCKIHALSTCMIISFMNNLTVEYTEFYNTPNNNDFHGNCIYIDKCSPSYIRYNYFHDIDTGTMVVYYCSCYGNSSNTDYGHIYGNVFSKFKTYQSSSVPALVFDSQCGTSTPYGSHFYVYNNTFADIANEAIKVYDSDLPNGGLRFQNNILHNVQKSSWSAGGSVAADYNTYSGSGHAQASSEAHGQDYGTGNPFVSYAANDYHLAVPTAGGIILDSPFTIDPDGKVRGADNTWDRGAYEYGTGGASTNAMIAISTNSLDFGSLELGTSKDLALSVKNTGGGTLTGSAVVASPFLIVAGGSYILNANQSQTVTIRYSPPAAATNSQSVTFTGGGGTTAQVRGVGRVAPAPPTGLRIVAAR